MLQTQAVEPRTLALLKELMTVPALDQCCLVGRTALALIYGHRVSIDLDIFAPESFDKKSIEIDLQRIFGARLVQEYTMQDWSIFCYIDDIKVDILRYPHPIISEVRIEEGIRIYGDRDLIAMKFNAILGRGSKKDFYDIAELLCHFDLTECISA